jgi:arsenate reductase
MIKDLNAKSGLLLKKFFNTSGQLYREMELSKKLPTMSDDAMLDLLASDGMLVKRPLLITDKKVLVGFKEDEWKEACL